MIMQIYEAQILRENSKAIGETPADIALFALKAHPFVQWR